MQIWCSYMLILFQFVLHFNTLEDQYEILDFLQRISLYEWRPSLIPWFYTPSRSGIHGWLDTPPRMKDWLGLHRKCLNQGLAIMEVPADGDCLAWSLRSLFLGISLTNGFTGRVAASEAKLVRQMISSAWQMCRCSAGWQKLFNCFCRDKVQEPVKTPKRADKKNKNKDKADAEDRLETPPRVNHKQPQPLRAPGAEPVPVAKKARPASGSLQHPAPKKAKALKSLEPEIPDIEELHHEVMMNPDPEPAEEETADLNDADPAEVDESMLGHDPEVRRRVAHSRPQKKEKSIRQVHERFLSRWLAKNGLTYVEWLNVHRLAAPLKKAGACQHGGFKVFKSKLLDMTLPSCPHCVSVLTQKSITMDGVEEVLKGENQDDDDDGGGDGDGPDGPEDPPGAPPPQSAETKPDGNEAEDAGTDNEWSRSVKYLNSLRPDIQPITDGPTLRYRCTLCITKGNPYGKINTLQRSRYNFVVHFMKQHLECDTHVKRVQERDAKQKKATEFAESGEESKCPGFCILDHRDSNLFFYLAEYKIWRSHNDFSAQWVQHTYSDTNDKPMIRHRECLKNFVPESDGQLCCRACLSLTDPRSVQKLVVRFAGKFYSARLLQKRLFSSQSELAEFMQEMKNTAFASKNRRYWAKFVQMNNAELQASVRKSFRQGSGEEEKPMMQHFRAAVVQPGLDIHVGATKSNLAALSNQFVEALRSNSQSAAWSFSIGWLRQWVHYYKIRKNRKQLLYIVVIFVCVSIFRFFKLVQ